MLGPTHAFGQLSASHPISAHRFAPPATLPTPLDQPRSQLNSNALRHFAAQPTAQHDTAFWPVTRPDGVPDRSVRAAERWDRRRPRRGLSWRPNTAAQAGRPRTCWELLASSRRSPAFRLPASTAGISAKLERHMPAAPLLQHGPSPPSGLEGRDWLSADALGG